MASDRRFESVPTVYRYKMSRIRTSETPNTKARTITSTNFKKATTKSNVSPDNRGSWDKIFSIGLGNLAHLKDSRMQTSVARSRGCWEWSGGRAKDQGPQTKDYRHEKQQATKGR
jgi:hypothetical protein